MEKPDTSEIIKKLEGYKNELREMFERVVPADQGRLDRFHERLHKYVQENISEREADRSYSYRTPFDELDGDFNYWLNAQLTALAKFIDGLIDALTKHPEEIISTSPPVPQRKAITEISQLPEFQREHPIKSREVRELEKALGLSDEQETDNHESEPGVIFGGEEKGKTGDKVFEIIAWLIVLLSLAVTAYKWKMIQAYPWLSVAPALALVFMVLSIFTREHRGTSVGAALSAVIGVGLIFALPPPAESKPEQSPNPISKGTSSTGTSILTDQTTSKGTNVIPVECIISYPQFRNGIAGDGKANPIGKIEVSVVNNTDHQISPIEFTVAVDKTQKVFTELSKDQEQYVRSQNYFNFTKPIYEMTIESGQNLPLPEREFNFGSGNKVSSPLRGAVKIRFSKGEKTLYKSFVLIPEKN